MQILAALLGLACSFPQQEYFKKPEKTISESRSAGDKIGEYEVAYETEGGISQREIGSRKYPGTKDETQLIQGSVTYVAPDGTPVSYSYTADEFGIKVVGSHIPTPPPVPIEIQKALEWLKTQPTTEEPPEYNNNGGNNLPSKNAIPSSISNPPARAQKPKKN